MKKLFGFFALAAIVAPLALAQPSLTLRPAAAFDNGSGQIDLSGGNIAVGEHFTVEVVLEGLNFELAGYEFEIQFPTWLTLVNSSLYESNGGAAADWPFRVDTGSLGTMAVQQLPADGLGVNNGATLNQDNGFTRHGAVITATGERPSSGDIVLGVFDFVLGRDFENSDPPTAQTEPDCISSGEVIKVLGCTGSPECPIIADGSANAVAVTMNAADLEVDLLNGDANWIKGDINKSGARDFFDVIPGLHCMILGLGVGSCSIMPGDPDAVQIADINCDGAIDFFDVLAHVKRAVGDISRRPAGKRRLSHDLAADTGVLQVENKASMGALSVVELDVSGQVSFQEIQLDKAAQDEGWAVFGNYIRGTKVYRAVMVNLKAQDAVIPRLAIPYIANGNAKVAVRATEAYTAGNEPVTVQSVVESVGVE